MTIAFKPGAHSREIASARRRAYLPCEYLKAADWDSEIFDDTRADQYRTVIFQNCYRDDDLALVARLQQRGGTAILDLCDNHSDNPEHGPEIDAQHERLQRMLNAVNAVTVSTPQIGVTVGRPVAVVDDALEPIQPDRLAWARRAWSQIRGGPLRVVWFGSASLEYPASGLVDLVRIMPDLAAAHAQHPMRLTVISDSKHRVDQMASPAPFPIRYREYNSVTSQHAIRDHDVCIIPESASPITICKTLNRPALALQLGVPVIADVIPSYQELRPYIGVGDWVQNIESICTYRAAWISRTEIGAEYLQMKYTPQRVLRQWADALAPFVAKAAPPQAA